MPFIARVGPNPNQVEHELFCFNLAPSPYRAILPAVTALRFEAACSGRGDIISALRQVATPRRKRPVQSHFRSSLTVPASWSVKAATSPTTGNFNIPACRFCTSIRRKMLGNDT